MTTILKTAARLWRLGGLLPWLIFGLLTPAWAQVQTAIVPDGSLGTTVSQSGGVHTIGGGTIRGPNQFHSFDRFDVGTGDTASFAGPASVENILSRVTGGQQSMIDGTLQSDIAGADLYLVNPSGVMFGPNARLDVMGSFHVSTADVVRLQDGGSFAATQPEQSVLTEAEPAAFGFLNEQPAGITLDGSRLMVPTGETFTLVGGDIEIIGNGEDAVIPSPDDSTGVPNLGAPDGSLNLASVAAPREVMINGPIHM